MSDVTLGEQGLTVPLESGAAYFNYYWLRDNCPSSFDRQTRERMFDIAALAEAPIAIRAMLEGEFLVVDWRNEDHQSRFALDWLSTFQAGSRPDPAALPRRVWRGQNYNQFARFERTALEGETALCALARALIEDGIALVTDVDDSDAALPELARQLGCIRPSVAGEFFEVRVHPDPVNLSFTAAALEMHTDTPAEEMAPGIQFLHCRANSVTGGDSLFLDGAAVAEDFRENHPEDFALLSEIDVPFFYEHDEFDWRAYQRVIELDRNGNVSGVTVSQHMADVFDLDQRELDSYYPAFVRFLKFMQSPDYLTRFRLNAGECIIFDNHRIVHGRTEYDSGSGSRHLRGCYIDRGELRSTYRTLARKTGAIDRSFASGGV